MLLGLACLLLVIGLVLTRSIEKAFGFMIISFIVIGAALFVWVITMFIGAENNQRVSTPQQTYSVQSPQFPLKTQSEVNQNSNPQPCPANDPLGLYSNCIAQTTSNPNDPAGIRWLTYDKHIRLSSIHKRYHHRGYNYPGCLNSSWSFHCIRNW